jgi:hypothetical protein
VRIDVVQGKIVTGHDHDHGHANTLADIARRAAQAMLEVLVRLKQDREPAA